VGDNMMMVLLCGLQRRYKMVDEKLIIAELVKAVKENRITLEQVPMPYLEQVKIKLQEENK